MPTWESEATNNPLWLDTSNPSLYTLKKYDESTGSWVPTAPSTAEDIGAYDKETVDIKLADLAGDIDAGLFTDTSNEPEIDGGVF